MIGIGRRGLGLLALGMAALAMPGSAAPALAQDGQPSRIVFVTHGQAADHYWSVVKKGVDDAAAALAVKAEYFAPDTFDVARMAELMDAAIASKPDGLVVSIPDPDALSRHVEGAVAAGIPVIVIDSGGVELTRKLGGLLYMGQSEFEAGVLAGERVARLGVTKAACVNHEVGNVSLDDRCAGFAKGLGQEVPVVAGVMDPIEMKNRLLAHLSARPDTQFLIACGVAAAEPALAALDEAGLAGRIKLGTFDLSPTILEAIDAGKMEWGIDAQQYLMGYMPVVMLDLLKRYKVQPLADYPTGPGFVTKADAASVVALSRQGIR